MRKVLSRSRKDRKLGGVCGGLAAYTRIDVTIWRIIFLFFALPGGPSIYIYVVLWIVMPLEPRHSHKEYLAEKILDKL